MPGWIWFLFCCPWGLVLVAGLWIVRRCGREWDRVTRRWPLDQ